MSKLRYIGYFFRAPMRVKGMLISCFFLAGYYRFVILYRPFAKLTPRIGKSWHETPGDVVPDRLDVIKQV